MRISKEQKQRIAKIAKKHGLKLVLLFGSFAKGTAHKNSDIDIAVLGEKKIDFKKQLRLANKLSTILKKDVDLSIINTANPLLLFQISKHSKIIFGNHRAYFEFRIHSFNRYNDYSPFFKMEATLNKKFINQHVNWP